MVKLSIITTTGTYAVFQDTSTAIVSDPDVLDYLDAAWTTYGRSASVLVNDVRVFLDNSGLGFTFATQANLSDSEPWQNFLLGIDPPAPVPPPTGVTSPPGSALYRLILQSGAVFDTGINAASCTRTNTAGCSPIQFGTLNAAIDYAYAHGELPYRVLTAEETWQLIEGTIPYDPARIYPPTTSQGGGGDTGILGLSNTALLVIGAGLLLLAGRGTK